jgi:hypothetical protein
LAIFRGCLYYPDFNTTGKTGGWKQPPTADRQSLNTAMPPVLTGGYLLFNFFPNLSFLPDIHEG